MTVSHEDGDIIIDQAIPLSKQGSSVQCDGMVVFALLVPFYDTEKLTGVTVQKHKDIAAHIVSMHAWIGCDAVSATIGIGRVKDIYISNKPPVMGNVQEDEQSLCNESTHPNMENINWS